MTKSKGIYTAFIDFRKAFDVMDRDMLHCKLVMDGIRGKMLNILKTIHGETWNILRINEVLSDEFRSHKGVLQGNTISPVLSCEFINGLIQEMKAAGLGVNVKKTLIFCCWHMRTT